MQPLRPLIVSLLVIIFAPQITPQTLTTIHHFTGGPSDGGTPFGGLAIGPGGALYGATTYGGESDCFAGCGTVFGLTPPVSPGSAWPETVYFFPGHNGGEFPNGGVLVGKSAVLYGTSGGGTCAASASYCGMVFALTPPASPGGSITHRVLHYFSGSPNDGFGPMGSLAMGNDGTLYGVTDWGGPNCLSSHGCGTVFSVTPPTSPGAAWTEKILYSFRGTPDGANPVAGVIIDRNGVLYGTTQVGGTGNNGTVFSLTPPTTPGGAWSEAVLHSFVGGTDGSYPDSSVTLGSQGTLYGTTYSGGSGCGIVFGVTPPTSPGAAWAEHILYTFVSPNDGCNPISGVVIGSGGMLYGATSAGGASRWGTLFSLHAPTSQGGSWTPTVLYTFTGTTDGGSPNSLVLGANGALYGTTLDQGATTCLNGCGTVFVLRP